MLIRHIVKRRKLTERKGYENQKNAQEPQGKEARD